MRYSSYPSTRVTHDFSIERFLFPLLGIQMRFPVTAGENNAHDLYSRSHILVALLNCPSPCHTQQTGWPPHRCWWPSLSALVSNQQQRHATTVTATESPPPTNGTMTIGGDSVVLGSTCSSRWVKSSWSFWCIKMELTGPGWPWHSYGCLFWSWKFIYFIHINTPN